MAIQNEGPVMQARIYLGAIGINVTRICSLEHTGAVATLQGDQLVFVFCEQCTEYINSFVTEVQALPPAPNFLPALHTLCQCRECRGSNPDLHERIVGLLSEETKYCLHEVEGTLRDLWDFGENEVESSSEEQEAQSETHRDFSQEWDQLKETSSGEDLFMKQMDLIRSSSEEELYTFHGIRFKNS